MNKQIKLIIWLIIERPFEGGGQLLLAINVNLSVMYCFICAIVE